jgi:hypothetical protein
VLLLDLLPERRRVLAVSEDAARNDNEMSRIVYFRSKVEGPFLHIHIIILHTGSGSSSDRFQ